MTENKGRTYEIRIMTRSVGRSMALTMTGSMVRNMVRSIPQIVELKFEPGNPGAGRKC